MTIEMERRCKSCKDFTDTSFVRERPLTVGEALQTVLYQSACEDRLVTGITDIATYLQSVPGPSVLLCVMETNADEDIRMKLLEAFCTEYKIKIIKVDNCQTICKKQQLNNHITEIDNEAVAADDKSPCACLVLKENSDVTPEEDFVLTFYETYKYCKNASPVLKLSKTKLNET